MSRNGTDAAAVDEEDVEVVDGLPVVAEVRAIEPARPAGQLVVQTAAVAATSFAVGAAAVVVAKKALSPAARRKRRHRRTLDALPITATRSFLVDVHVLDRR